MCEQIIEETQIEKVEHYTYLGKLISFSDGMEKELRTRKKKARNSFWALKIIFKEAVTVKANTRILVMCMVPVLCYRTQTWGSNKFQIEEFRVT